MDQISLFDSDLAPYQHHSETSKAAAVAIEPSRESLKGKVLAYLRTAGKATDEQMQEALQMNPSTQRPRRIELWKAGLVRDSGIQKATKSGRMAAVWEAV